MDQSIFKAYDIRGIYPDQLNEQDAYDIARAYATWLQRLEGKSDLTLVVGQDMRLSSPALHEKLVQGLVDSGVHVADIGLVSTPTFYFAVAWKNYDGGIQISASHNPKEYNGLKMVRAKSGAVGRDTGMADIKSLAMGKDFNQPKNPGAVTLEKDMTKVAEGEQLKGIATEKIKPFKIVIDAANAMGALDMDALFTSLPCEIIKLNFELDGSFPAHEADPFKPENLRFLQDAVIQHGADLGIATDGDGDRVFFVDNAGELIRPEIVRGIMAQVALGEHPGATVCYDIRPGRITRDMIEAMGGRAIVTRVGHSLIKETMVKENAVFGGESSGHFFYQFPYGTFEAPMVLVAKFLIWLSEKNSPAAESVAPYRKYFHSNEINSKVADVLTVLERIKNNFASGKISELDGITVEYDSWWFNVRGSNTEPLIRLNLEANSQALMEQKRDEVLATIRA